MVIAWYALPYCYTIPAASPQHDIHTIMSKPQNAPAHEILGISADSPISDVKKAYKNLALRTHPDKNPANNQQAQEAFNRIINAYNQMEKKDGVYAQMRAKKEKEKQLPQKPAQSPSAQKKDDDEYVIVEEEATKQNDIPQGEPVSTAPSTMETVKEYATQGMSAAASADQNAYNKAWAYWYGDSVPAPKPETTETPSYIKNFAESLDKQEPLSDQ